MPLMENILKPLARMVLIQLALIAAAAKDAAIHNKMLGSGIYPSDLAKQITLIISNKEMKDILKIVKSLEESGLLIIGDSETIQNEVKEEKKWFFGLLLGTLDASLLGNILTRKNTIGAGESTIIGGQDF